MSDPFASAQDFAQFIGLGIPDDLARMQAHLRAASAAIRGFCGQTLSPVAADVVTLEAVDGDTLILPQRPVTAITTVTVNTVPTTAYTFTRSGLLRSSSGLAWSLGATVTYDHGYAEGTDEYEEVRTICMEAASRAYTLNERSASEVLGSTLMESAGYAPEVFLTPGEKMRLTNFGEVAVA